MRARRQRVDCRTQAAPGHHREPARAPRLARSACRQAPAQALQPRAAAHGHATHSAAIGPLWHRGRHLTVGRQQARRQPEARALPALIGRVVGAVVVRLRVAKVVDPPGTELNVPVPARRAATAAAARVRSSASGKQERIRTTITCAPAMAPGGRGREGGHLFFCFADRSIGYALGASSVSLVPSLNTCAPPAAGVSGRAANSRLLLLLARQLHQTAGAQQRQEEG